MRYWSYLFVSSTILVLSVVLGCSPAVQKVSARTDGTRAMERRTHELINEYRAARKLTPLVWNDLISEQALGHSVRMASNRVEFSHVGFETRMKELAERMRFRSSAENIAVNRGYDDPVTMFIDGWMKSPGHLENIVGNFDQTGVGIARSEDGSYYATQIFVLTR